MDRVKTGTRRIWLTLEAEEIIELKRLMMDRDVAGANTFFHRVVAPRVRCAADRRGMSAEVSPREFDEQVTAG